jgi:hypothetical protein
MIKRLLLFVLYGFALCVQAAPPTDRFDVTLISVLPDGELKRETRPLRADEIRAMGVFDQGAPVAKGQDDGAPPRPNAPINGSVPDDLMRIDYHRVLNGWTRDTAYGRNVPGGPWNLINDLLRRGGGGGGSGGVGSDCPPGSGDNCVDLN